MCMCCGFTLLGLLRQRLLAHKPWRAMADVVEGFEEHEALKHHMALQAWLLHPSCPAILRWEADCGQLDASRGDDFDWREDDYANNELEEAEKEYDEWMNIVSQTMFTQGDEMSGDVACEATPTWNWAWWQQGSRLDMQYLKSWLETSKQELGDKVRAVACVVLPTL